MALPVVERIRILGEIKEALMQLTEVWARTAARKKRIAIGSPLIGCGFLRIFFNALRG